MHERIARARVVISGMSNKLHRGENTTLLTGREHKMTVKTCFSEIKESFNGKQKVASLTEAA